MSSADSALRRLGPRCPPPGAAVAAPQVGRAALPARAPCAQRPWRILQHHSGPPSRSHRRRRQSPRPPLKGPSPGLCHGILARGPLPCLPSPDLRLGETGGTSVAPAASVPSRGKFISGAGAGHSSIHSPLAGVGVGVRRVLCMGACA